MFTYLSPGSSKSAGCEITLLFIRTFRLWEDLSIQVRPSFIFVSLTLFITFVHSQTELGVVNAAMMFSVLPAIHVISDLQEETDLATGNTLQNLVPTIFA